MTNERPPGDDDDERSLVGMEQEAQLIRADVATMSALNRSEIDAQMDAAHRYPRVLSTFRKEATTIAISNQDVAKSCIYSLERWDSKARKKKYIVGPSIRLAEICATTYRNLHAGSRAVDVDKTTVTCQGVAWDIQNNVRQVAEVTRRITTTEGNRFSDDMIIMTQNAAAAIALRNAIFRVIPRALIAPIFDEARAMAAGGKKPMPEKQRDIMAAMERIGVSADRALDAVDRKTPEDLTLEDIEILIGLGARVSHEKEPIDEVFPRGMTATEVPQGTRQPIRKPGTTAPAATTPPPAATAKPAEKAKQAPENAISNPPAAAAQAAEEDPDAAARAAVAPTAAEIAAHEAETKNKGTTNDEETPEWARR